MDDTPPDVSPVAGDPPPGYTPVTTTTTDPSGQTRTLTGYGIRRPLVPPNSAALPMPDLAPAFSQAFQQLPVDEAMKAVDAAIRYQGQRGYMRDLQNGMNAAQAFAKWGPMLFKQATGIPEAIDRSVPAPLSAYQKAQLAKPSLHAVSGGLYRVPPTGTPETLVAPPVKPTPTPKLSEAAREDLKDAYRELDAARRDMAKNSTMEITSPEVIDASTRMGQATQRIRKIVGAPVAPPTAAVAATSTPSTATPFKEGSLVKNKKDGKIYKIINGKPVAQE